jgi:hypothetical protein
MSTWMDSRRYNEEERHRISLEAMRRHPLAMDPAVVQREAAASLARARPQLATILQFRQIEPAPFADVSRAMNRENVGQTPGPQQRATGPATLEQVAREYLRHPAPPNGHAKALAAERGVNYGSLLTKITLLRGQSRFA